MMSPAEHLTIYVFVFKVHLNQLSSLNPALGSILIGRVLKQVAVKAGESGSPVPYVWLDATYVKCRRGGRVASTAVVTAIGCDAGGWRRLLGVDVVDTEP